MTLGKSQQRLGNLTKDNISFPKHLTPEIIHSALFIHNAPRKEDIKTRVEYCARQIGNEAMSYAMALLVLPTLMDNMREHSQDYKDFITSRKKTVH
jgi:hypothetical protein